MSNFVCLWGGPPCASQFLLFTTPSFLYPNSSSKVILLDSFSMLGYCFCRGNILSTGFFFVLFFSSNTFHECSWKNSVLYPSLVLIYSVRATVLMLCAVPVVPVFTHSSLCSEIVSRQGDTVSTLKCLISIKRDNLSSRMCSMQRRLPLTPRGLAEEYGG